MKTQLNLVILIACIYAVTGGNIRRKKQLGTGTGTGVSFAFPGLNLFGGGLGNNNGNVFGGATFTRTLVSTVSTVTTPSFRTCTMPVGALAMTPCVGRRKREADIMMASYNYDNEIFMDHNNDDVNNLGIEPSASIALIIGTTTITDPLAVSEYLLAHQPSSQSIIYPHDISISEIENLENLQTLKKQEHDTHLYPSNDSPDVQQDDATTTVHAPYNNDDTFAEATTEIPLNDEEVTELQNTTPRLEENNDEEGESDEKGRRGLGKTTTVTTVIRVTSVATTLASGMSATLTVMYAGCLPPSLPVSGIPC